MNKTELPTSWCVAEVVSWNRHTYNLRYDCCYPRVEKVSREFIRPCPPRANNWVVGDIVEVLDDSSWKTATLVCKVSDGGHFSLRPHGLAYEIIVHKSNIRARQVWQHSQWVPIVKISGNYGDVKPNCESKFGLQIPMPDGCEENDDNLLIYNNADAGLLKRASPFCSDDVCNKKPKDDDVFASNANGFYENERISEPNNYSTDNCSVGSCSNKWSSPYETDLVSSDAESSNTPRDEDGVIHRLELHAYRFTLEALYAFGPLTWEKEALLTNLRINLHISNDEHLIELRNLISTD
ncbi:hypothetical protein L1987_80755 [Smallanthus sonchifolius]|uniref:Uncharacterized protein n=1 Tax=Smallanthus sonchifolius TaxID=185202 RepID=A0ACB8YP03_9ASTR|nr:hypothetical protein L1987_80755 [Smallanthus sonchifolius]